jgi:hypothetical protein
VPHIALVHRDEPEEGSNVWLTALLLVLVALASAVGAFFLLPAGWFH